MYKPILCLDFDGVIHSYTSGWEGADVISDPPIDGAIEFLYEAIWQFDVQIYSSRSHQDGGIAAMMAWLALWEDVHRETLRKNNQPIPRTSLLLNLKFPTQKPAAFLTIDDRAITFTGIFPTIKTLQAFKPWYK